MAIAAQPAVTRESAAAYRDRMVEDLAREAETTKEFILAVPDAGRDHRPDPKALTAWELAFHMASADVQFLNEIADGRFAAEPRYRNEFKNPAELAAWYEKEFRGGLERVKKLDGEELTRSLDLYGELQRPAVLYLQLVMVHMAHHRGQLSVYLDPMGAKEPNIFGIGG